MNQVERRTLIKVLKWILGIAVMLPCLWLALFVSLYSCERPPEAPVILKSLPMGVGVDEVEPVRRKWELTSGDVVEWLDDESKRTLPVHPDNSAKVQTPYGKFWRQYWGEYAQWRPTQQQKESFTGTITFIHERGFANWESIHLTFIRGRLVKSEWGEMPG